MDNLKEMLAQWDANMEKEYTPDPGAIIMLGDRIIGLLQKQVNELTTRAEQAERNLKILSKKEELKNKGESIRLTNQAIAQRDEYHRLYDLSKNQVDVYQQEIIPGFRERAEQAEAREKVLKDALEPFAWFGERAKDFIPQPNKPDDWSIKTDRIKFVRAYEALAGDGEDKP